MHTHIHTHAPLSIAPQTLAPCLIKNLDICPLSIASGLFVSFFKKCFFNLFFISEHEFKIYITLIAINVLCARSAK